jgi:hypothetical protein
MKTCLILLMLIPLIGKPQIVETIAGNGIAGYIGDGGLSKEADVIRKINTAGIISTIAGNGYGAGLIGVGGYTGDGGPATAAELNGPGDLAFDNTGNIYFGDQGSVIRKINTAGIITTIAGNETIGYNGDGIPAITAQLYGPIGLVFDNAGNLFFSDEGNARVRKISTTGIITTVAGNGARGYSGDGGPATAAQLREPCLLAFSPSGDLYIPDWAEQRVRMVNSSGIITTIAGNGSSANDGDGGPATNAGISGCSEIIFDNSGNYFISNNVVCAIRKVNSTGIITTAVGNDSCGYNGDGLPATSTKINYSTYSSAIDAAGNLYFADSKNNRIRRILYNATTVNSVINTPQIITISPSPATNTITISTGDKIENIAITNMVGQAIYNQLYYKVEKTDVEVAGWAVGVYFIKVNGVYAGKFVKD